MCEYVLYCIVVYTHFGTLPQECGFYESTSIIQNRIKTQVHKFFTYIHHTSNRRKSKKVKETLHEITDYKCTIKGGLHRTPASYLTLKPTGWGMENVWFKLVEKVTSTVNKRALSPLGSRLTNMKMICLTCNSRGYIPFDQQSRVNTLRFACYKNFVCGTPWNITLIKLSMWGWGRQFSVIFPTSVVFWQCELCMWIFHGKHNIGCDINFNGVHRARHLQRAGLPLVPPSLMICCHQRVASVQRRGSIMTS